MSPLRAPAKDAVLTRWHAKKAEERERRLAKSGRRERSPFKETWTETITGTAALVVEEASP
jgi:hypothetical protein